MLVIQVCSAGCDAGAGARVAPFMLVLVVVMRMQVLQAVVESVDASELQLNLEAFKHSKRSKHLPWLEEGDA